MRMFYGADGRALKKAKPKRTRPEGEPIIETTHGENVAVRRFLKFMIDDIAYQLEQMSNDTGVSRETLIQSEENAEILSFYLSQYVQELDRLIANVPNPTAADFRKTIGAQKALN